MFKDAEKTERFCQHVIDIDTIQGNNAPGPDDFRGDCYWLDELKETGWIRFLESQYECFVSVRLVNVSNTKQKLR